MTALSLLCLLVSIGFAVSVRAHRRDLARSKRIIRKLRRRRDVLADQCEALVMEWKSGLETACELQLECDAFYAEEERRLEQGRDVAKAMGMKGMN